MKLVTVSVAVSISAIVLSAVTAGLNVTGSLSAQSDPKGAAD